MESRMLFFFSWLTIPFGLFFFVRGIGRESKFSDLENWVQNRGRVADVFWASASINTNTLVILMRSPPWKLTFCPWKLMVGSDDPFLLKWSLFRGHSFIFGGYQLIDYQLFGVKALHPRNLRWFFCSPFFERKSNYIFKIRTQLMNFWTKQKVVKRLLNSDLWISVNEGFEVYESSLTWNSVDTGSMIKKLRYKIFSYQHPPFGVVFEP